MVTSPPYWDILLQNRTADYKEIRNYGDSDQDLGRISGYQGFLGALGDVFSNILTVLKPGCYCCVIVMDLRKGSKLLGIISQSKQTPEPSVRGSGAPAPISVKPCPSESGHP